MTKAQQAERQRIARTFPVGTRVELQADTRDWTGKTYRKGSVGFVTGHSDLGLWISFSAILPQVLVGSLILKPYETGAHNG
jgi:hypothetical protein